MKKRIELTCPRCGRRFHVKPSRLAVTRHCSMACKAVPGDIKAEVLSAYEKREKIQGTAARLGISVTFCYNVLRSAAKTRSLSDSKRIHPLNERYFENPSTEEQCYWLGFLAADGCVSGQNSQITLALASSDRQHIERFKAAIQTTAPVRDSWHRTGRLRRWKEKSVLAVASRKMQEDLVRLGITPRKSLTLDPWIPPGRLAVAFFRGLVDGDGWIIRDKRGLWTVGLIGSSPVVHAFAEFIRGSLGIVGRPKPHGRVYGVRYGGLRVPQAVASLIWGGATIYLPRKKERADELARQVPRRRPRAGTAAVAAARCPAICEPSGVQ